MEIDTSACLYACGVHRWGVVFSEYSQRGRMAWAVRGWIWVCFVCKAVVSCEVSHSRLSDMRSCWVGLGYPRCLELLCHELCNTDDVRR